jgi:hypothetical protein
MSIRLTQLLGLSYDLAQGRKRRSEWEAFAEKATSVNGDEASLTGGYCYSDESSGDSGGDAAEMQLLRAALRAQGLAPRAPDAEHAFLRLMCADRRPKARKIEWTDFDWMVTVDVVEPAGKVEILCPPKAGKKGADSDSTFARLLADTFSEETVNPFGPPSELLSADAPQGPDQLPHTEDLHEHGDVSTRLPVALARLSALLSCDSASSSSDVTSTESANEEFYDEDSREPSSRKMAMMMLSEEDAIFREEGSREAMIEAEQEELSRMLAQEVAEEVEKISISGN